MKKRLGNYETASLAVNGNNTVIPYNPRRKYLQISSTSSAGIYIQFGTAVAVNGVGFRISSSLPGIELRYEDVGDLVTQPVSVWNGGAAGSSFAWVEAWDYDDL